MRPVIRELVRWGALGAEMYFLFVLFWCIGICSCPLTPRNLGQFSLFVIGAGACAYVSASQFNKQKTAERRTIMQIVLEPPIAIWIIAILLLLVKVTSPGYANHGYQIYRTR
jgi:hypothetical protein